MFEVVTTRVINGRPSIVDYIKVERKHLARWVRKFVRDPHAEFIAVRKDQPMVAGVDGFPVLMSVSRPIKR